MILKHTDLHIKLRKLDLRESFRSHLKVPVLLLKAVSQLSIQTIILVNG